MRVSKQVVKVTVKMPAFKAEKLRVNLRLSINRLKLLEKKKSKCNLLIRRSTCPGVVRCTCGVDSL